MGRKKREHCCELGLKRQGNDVSVMIACDCGAHGEAKLETLPDVEAADVVTFKHNMKIHRCPATRLALARVGLGGFQDGCMNHGDEQSKTHH